MNEPLSTDPPSEPEIGYAAPPAQVTAATAAAAALPALSRQALFARIGLLGIAVAALLAAVILVLSSSAAPHGTLAAGTGNNAANGPIDVFNGGPGLKGGRGFGIGFGQISITAINGNNISLKTEDGWTRTITVDLGTTYTKAGATISLGDLKVGDEVGFKQTLESNGTWSIDSITVILPTAGGQVTKIDGSTITVTRRSGSTATIRVDAQTKYSVNGNDGAALSDIKVNMFLVAEGTKNSDGSLTARNIKAGSISTFEGRGGLGRGFRFGPGGPDQDGTSPGSSAAPGASGTAS